jgi:NAD(P)-dependent dehydrogenase (short-subunit alcohol dehydrogenase family)
MGRVFITGSAAGLGLGAAKLLAEAGHDVTLHARDDERARDVRAELVTKDPVVVGDVTTLAGMRAVAEQANDLGRYDAIIHNAAIGYQERRKITTADGLAHLFAINVLAPYVLTALMPLPERLVYLSSGMHRGGDPDLGDPQWERRRWSGSRAYSDSKLFDAVLAAAVARRRPGVLSNAVDPGWVATKMGGPGAPEDFTLGCVTQVWLATGETPEARVSGGYFYHQKPAPTHPAVRSAAVQDDLLGYCEHVSGIPRV